MQRAVHEVKSCASRDATMSNTPAMAYMADTGRRQCSECRSSTREVSSSSAQCKRMVQCPWVSTEQGRHPNRSSQIRSASGADVTRKSSALFFCSPNHEVGTTVPKRFLQPVESPPTPLNARTFTVTLQERKDTLNGILPNSVPVIVWRASLSTQSWVPRVCLQPSPSRLSSASSGQICPLR